MFREIDKRARNCADDARNCCSCVQNTSIEDRWKRRDGCVACLHADQTEGGDSKANSLFVFQAAVRDSVGLRAKMPLTDEEQELVKKIITYALHNKNLKLPLEFELNDKTSEVVDLWRADKKHPFKLNGLFLLGACKIHGKNTELIYKLVKIVFDSLNKVLDRMKFGEYINRDEANTPLMDIDEETKHKLFKGGLRFVALPSKIQILDAPQSDSTTRWVDVDPEEELAPMDDEYYICVFGNEYVDGSERPDILPTDSLKIDTSDRQKSSVSMDGKCPDSTSPANLGHHTPQLSLLCTPVKKDLQIDSEDDMLMSQRGSRRSSESQARENREGSRENYHFDDYDMPHDEPQDIGRTRSMEGSPEREEAVSSFIDKQHSKPQKKKKVCSRKRSEGARNLPNTPSIKRRRTGDDSRMSLNGECISLQNTQGNLDDTGFDDDEYIPRDQADYDATGDDGFDDPIQMIDREGLRDDYGAYGNNDHGLSPPRSLFGDDELPSAEDHLENTQDKEIGEALPIQNEPLSEDDHFAQVRRMPNQDDTGFEDMLDDSQQQLDGINLHYDDPEETSDGPKEEEEAFVKHTQPVLLEHIKTAKQIKLDDVISVTNSKTTKGAARFFYSALTLAKNQLIEIPIQTEPFGDIILKSLTNNQ